MKKLKIGDMIIAIVVLTVSFAIFSFFRNRMGDGQAIAQIIKDGKVIQTVRLDQSKPVRIVITGKYTNVIIAENKTIRFEESDCPDHTCERIGPIGKPGQSAACVPAGVIIKIIGSTDDDTDIVIR